MAAATERHEETEDARMPTASPSSDPSITRETASSRDAAESTSQPLSTPGAFRDYYPGKKIGEGHYATVKECVNVRTGKTYAMKILALDRMNHEDRKEVEREIGVMEAIGNAGGHPNVVRLWDHFLVGGELYLVMDLAQGGELFEQICDWHYFVEADAAS
ncbi:hypothetical protein HDU93_008911, partial [Gonapodya sp. JEL0774]